MDITASLDNRHVFMHLHHSPKQAASQCLGALRDEKHVRVFDSCRSRSLASNKSQLGATSGV